MHVDPTDYAVLGMMLIESPASKRNFQIVATDVASGNLRRFLSLAVPVQIFAFIYQIVLTRTNSQPGLPVAATGACSVMAVDSFCFSP